MANQDFTQEIDTSLFKLQSYGWRKVDLGADYAIRVLESAYQSTYAIEGLMKLLQEQVLERNRQEEPTISRLEDQLMVAINLLSQATNSEICKYAESLQKRISEQEKHIQ